MSRLIILVMLLDLSFFNYFFCRIITLGTNRLKGSYNLGHFLCENIFREAFK